MISDRHNEKEKTEIFFCDEYSGFTLLTIFSYTIAVVTVVMYITAGPGIMYFCSGHSVTLMRCPTDLTLVSVN